MDLDSMRKYFIQKMFKKINETDKITVIGTLYTTVQNLMDLRVRVAEINTF